MCRLVRPFRFTASQMREHRQPRPELKTLPKFGPSWPNLVQALLHLCVLPRACGRTAHSRRKITNHERLIFRGRLVEQMLGLSLCFRSDQFENMRYYDFGHTLDVQQTHLRGQFIEQRLIMVTLCCAT